MQVDDAFVAAVLEKSGTHYPIDIIRATLAVAAERGLVVPEGAPRMWGVKTCNKLNPLKVFRTHTAATSAAFGEGTVVRVAIVEIKEDGK